MKRHLELYCCAGGSAADYARAGLQVYGVDRDPQPSFPFPFHQRDALTALDTLLGGLQLSFRHPDGSTELLRRADFHSVGASAPCQDHTALTKGNRKRPGWKDDHVDLIPPTRVRLDTLGLPYVMENVQGSSLRRDLTLCGEMFGLGVIRHRYFELGGWTMPRPVHVPHRGRVAGWRHGVLYDGPYLAVYGDGGGKGTVKQWQQAMGIDWTDDRRELAEAIPPAYTEHIGRELIKVATR